MLGKPSTKKNSLLSVKHRKTIKKTKNIIPKKLKNHSGMSNRFSIRKLKSGGLLVKFRNIGRAHRMSRKANNNKKKKCIVKLITRSKNRLLFNNILRKMPMMLKSTRRKK